MTDEDLRARLERADPARRPDVAAYLESRTAHDIRERAMETMSNDAHGAADDTNASRPVLAVLTAAATLAVVVGGAVLAARPDGAAPPKAEKKTLALSVPRGDVMASCIAFDVAFLKEMPVAFGGTVASVDDGTVTIDVDHWYKGGDATTVTVTNPGGEHAVALDGVEFTAGGRYLVTATDGTVNGCGFSGPESAELTGAFEEAFS